MMTTNDDDGDKPNNFDLFAACSYAREHVRTVVSDGRTSLPRLLLSYLFDR